MTEAAHPDERGLDDLDPSALLDLLAAEDLARRTADRNILLIAHQWAVLHPATSESGTSTWGGDQLLLADESLGGEGCPQVAAYAAEPLAITLGVSPTTAMQLIADALDLRHRLPKTWQQVQTLAVPAWKGRQVAVLTHTLSQEAAGWVDDHIAPRLRRCGARAVDTVVAQAIAKYDPDRHAERERKAKRQHWDVVLHPPVASEYAATSELHITGDTLLLTDLYQRVCATAAAAGKDGDDAPLGVRKIQALATLFGGQAKALGPVAEEVAQRPSRSPGTTPTKPPAVLYVHLDLTDLTDDLVRVGRVERLGPVTTDTIRDWLGRSEVRIQPVIRADGDDAVNGHDPPDRIRDQVILRDQTCRFPGCQINARRCDLDHVVPYDPGGPPGQTSPSRLTALCRRHHNAKTSGLWRYTRTPNGACIWTGPHTSAATG